MSKVAWKFPVEQNRAQCDPLAAVIIESGMLDAANEYLESPGNEEPLSPDAFLKQLGELV